MLLGVRCFRRRLARRSCFRRARDQYRARAGETKRACRSGRWKAQTIWSCSHATSPRKPSSISAHWPAQRPPRALRGRVELMVTPKRAASSSRGEDCRRVEECLSRHRGVGADPCSFGRVDRPGDSYVAILSLLNVDDARRARGKRCTERSASELFGHHAREAVDRLFGGVASS